ncbi:MAG: arginine--tRNA ligase [Candidatus Woesearchaeota archaeon]
MDYKKEIIKLLEKELKIKDIILEVPPSNFGDYSFPCFKLQNSNDKAKELANKIKANFLDKIEARGPYLNFFINKKHLAENTIKQILKEKENYGKGKEGNGKKIVIDMSSPNIAKPFGIGHLRSTIIGNSLANIFSKLGYKVIKINYLGDWGTQFGKLMLGYKKFGNEKELKKNPIKHMYELYVKVNSDESLENEAREWFKKLENGDREALTLWKKFKELSLKDFNKIYRLLNIKFDIISGESFYNKKMNKTIEELKEKKLLEESEGALIVDLKKYDLGVCLIQKSDGTTLYATRDLTAAIDRHNKYKFLKMIYEVGSEQKLHFKQVFKILDLIGYKWAKDCVHIEHGFYLDKDGKKLATRKGKSIFMEDIINETIELAKKTIQHKNPKLRNKEEIAKKIAVGAIFYGDLKNNRVNDSIFDIEKFLDFEGDTGPYLQYSYVRACSVLDKSKKKITKFNIINLEDKEIELIKKLAEFPDVIRNSYNNYSPNVIANYAFKLAQTFSEFYQCCKVIGSNEEQQRLAIVQAFKFVMKNSLNLLGIDVIEEM